LYQKQIKYNTAKNLLLISSFTICLASLSTWLGNSLQENATQNTLDNISTLTNRTVLWESASEIISEHPWFGNGFGSLVDLPALKSVAGETGIWSAHNGLLDYWLAHGIFSMLIFLAYIYFIMFKLYKLSTHSLNHQERSSALGIFIGLFLMLIHGLVEPLLFDSKFLIFIGLIAGGITSSNQYVDGRRDAFFDGGTFATTNVFLGSYQLLNGLVKYDVLKNRMTVFGAINNILNEEFEETIGYNSRGRNVKLGFTFLF
jgi:O-antigen ligase